jgi:hypothetical protein
MPLASTFWNAAKYLDGNSTPQAGFSNLGKNIFCGNKLPLAQYLYFDVTGLKNRDPLTSEVVKR